MRLTDLGWNEYFECHFRDEETDGCVAARVSEESKGFYCVLAEDGEFLAQVAGRVRYRAEDRSDFPAVGDWVAIQPRPSEGRATIAAILPRRTVLSRKTAGRGVGEQILAANLDIVFVVASLNHEFNLRRIERYLAMAWESGALPVVLLNKTDLCARPESACTQVERGSPGAAVHSLSATKGWGLERVRQYLTTGRTAAFVGSSGVGKSTIINALLGQSTLRVQPVRNSDDRGRHTTTSRHMFGLPDGGVVVDTPGMRELQLWESEAGLANAFDDLEALARQCKYRDCRHHGDPGCAVAAAIEDGRVTRGRLENYLKLERELRFLATKTDGDARHAAKARAKQLCKAARQFYKLP